MLNVVSLLIPPTSTLLTKGKVSSLMKTKSKRQRKFKETWVSKKWNKSGATLDERWRRRRRTKDKKEMDDDWWSGVATRKVEATVGIWVSFFFFTVGLHFTGRFSFSGRYPVFFPKRPVRPGIWSGTKQPYFCSDLSTGTENSGRYNTESTFLIKTNSQPRKKK